MYAQRAWRAVQAQPRRGHAAIDAQRLALHAARISQTPAPPTPACECGARRTRTSVAVTKFNTWPRCLIAMYKQLFHACIESVESAIATQATSKTNNLMMSGLNISHTPLTLPMQGLVRTIESFEHGTPQPAASTCNKCLPLSAAVASTLVRNHPLHCSLQVPPRWTGVRAGSSSAFDPQRRLRFTLTIHRTTPSLQP